MGISLCLCGCKKEVTYNKYKLREYVSGHNSRVSNPNKNNKWTEKQKVNFSKKIKNLYNIGKIRNPRKGTKLTEETRKKISEKKRLWYKNNKHPREGIKLDKKLIERIRLKNISNGTYKRNSEFMKLNNPMKNKILREKATETLKERYSSGELKPSMLGKKFSEETRKKISEKAKLRIGDKNSFYGKTHSNEFKDFMCNNNPNKNGKLFKNEEFLEKWITAMNRKPNKLEKFLIDLLNKNFPNEWKYVGNFKFWIEGKNPDFINCNGKKLIIESYCKYWKERNYSSIGEFKQQRSKIFLKYGYRTLFIEDKELKNEEKVIQKIERFIG